MFSSRRLRLVAGLAVAAIAAVVAVSSGTSATSATTLTVWVDSPQKPAIDASAAAWGGPKGVTVNVLVHAFGGIRDDLKTVKPDSAPDIIIGPHDWVGDLATNGLVLPLYPKAATKAQFPQYALDAFSYGTAIKKLYGAPYALENVGIVVNTKLV